MANVYTTDMLITDVVLLGHIPLNTDPSASNPYSPVNILRLGTIEIQTPIMKQILSTRGGYYLTYMDLPVVADGLYPMPPLAISGALANVELVQGPTIVPVNLISESEQFSTISPTSTSYGFFIQANQVQILPIPNVGVTRLWYFGRTSELTPTSLCAQASSIPTGNVVTVNSVPANLVVGSLVDTVGDQPPFNILNQAIAITSIIGNQITLSAAPTLMLSGDWIALSGTTPVPQIPVEFRLLLAQRIVCKIYEAQGYSEKLKIARQTLLAYESDTFGLITPRVQSQSKIFNPVNGGWLTSGTRRFNYLAGALQ